MAVLKSPKNVKKKSIWVKKFKLKQFKSNNSPIRKKQFLSIKLDNLYDLRQESMFLIEFSSLNKTN